MDYFDQESRLPSRFAPLPPFKPPVPHRYVTPTIPKLLRPKYRNYRGCLKTFTHHTRVCPQRDAHLSGPAHVARQPFFHLLTCLCPTTRIALKMC